MTVWTHPVSSLFGLVIVKGFDTSDTAALSKQVSKEKMCDADAGPFQARRSILFVVGCEQDVTKTGRDRERSAKDHPGDSRQKGLKS